MPVEKFKLTKPCHRELLAAIAPAPALVGGGVLGQNMVHARAQLVATNPDFSSTTFLRPLQCSASETRELRLPKAAVKDHRNFEQVDVACPSRRSHEQRCALRRAQAKSIAFPGEFQTGPLAHCNFSVFLH